MSWDPATIATLLSAIGLPTATAYLARQLVKRHRGNLTRAQADNIRADRAEKTVTRLYVYISELRADAIARGDKPRPWPRGLKPRE